MFPAGQRAAGPPAAVPHDHRADQSAATYGRSTASTPDRQQSLRRALPSSHAPRSPIALEASLPDPVASSLGPRLSTLISMRPCWSRDSDGARIGLLAVVLALG